MNARRISRSLVLLAFACFATSLAGGEQTYPGATWQRLAAPEELGWSREKLTAARDYAGTLKTAAVMIVVDGQVLDEWGETARRFQLHSIRKSLLSALYGIHVSEKHIDLAKTMAELGIDDNEPSLTSEEKKATLADLIKARSGIYHPALYETDSRKAERPPRGSHPSGTFWYYNNWDFNVLGTAFERLTKTNLFAEFKTRIAEAIEMEDFRLQDGNYLTGANSVYPAYLFRMSARDMARLGLLYLRNGAWRDKQIVPSDWVKASTTSYSNVGEQGGFGYMWWVAVGGKHLQGISLPDGSYSARGAGGHYLLVVPAYDLVIVHRVNTDFPNRFVTSAQFGELVRLILAARQDKSTN